MSLTFLQSIGLSSQEAQIYELLLSLGEVPAHQIIAKSGMKRSSAYTLLYSLEKKKLLTKRDIGKITNFKAEPPTQLLQVAEEQIKEKERAREDLRSMLPQMLSTYTMNVEKPIVLNFEGPEGLKKAHLEILAEKKEILAYVLIDEKLDEPLEDFWPEYYRQREKDNIFIRSISPNNKEGLKYKKDDSKQLRTTRLIPENLFPFLIEKNICGNKVAFFSREAGKLVATIIINKAIADTERSIFELAWEQAEIYDRNLASISQTIEHNDALNK